MEELVLRDHMFEITDMNICLLLLLLSRFSRVRLFVTLRSVALQAPLSMGFCRQEYWSGAPFPSPVDLPDPGIELTSLMSPGLASGFVTTSTTWEALLSC